MWWLKILTGLPSLLSEGISAWSKHDQKAMDVSLEKYKVDGRVDEAKVQAEAVRINAIVESHRQDTSFGGRLMRYIFVYPLGIWWIAIIIDSIFQDVFNWKWNVGSVPVLVNWGGWMIAYLFLHSTLIEGGRK